MAEKMNITCNGAKKEISVGTILVTFIQRHGLSPDTVIVQCNGDIVPRDAYESFILPESCTLELVRFVGGG